MSQTILFFGNERLATGVTTTTPVLQALLAANYKVAAVVVAQADSNASRRARPLEVAELAAKHDIPVLVPASLDSAELTGFGAEAAVLVAYGKLVPADMIGLLPRGIINIHPSLLPKHRGSTPIESVILHGETETGVSLMALDKTIDGGAVYAQQKLMLSGTEGKQGLADQLSKIGAELLVKHLPEILDGTLTASPQDETQATYDEKITRAGGELDWQKPAAVLVREIRAYLGWPRSRTTLLGKDVVITSAHVRPNNGNSTNEGGREWIRGQELGVHTTNGILIVDSLIPNGKPEMSASAFLAGYRN
jgi:methionyl-tRNA formyltransferase